MQFGHGRLLTHQNVIGSRLTLLIGACGYPIYVGGLWAFQVHAVRAFLIVSGGILGFCEFPTKMETFAPYRRKSLIILRRWSPLDGSRCHHHVLPK